MPKMRNDKIPSVPEPYMKGLILGGLGAPFGVAIGWYLHTSPENIALYISLGALAGVIFGASIAVGLGKWIPLVKLYGVQRKADVVLGFLSLAISLAGIVGFMLTGKMIGLVGAMFFILCAMYLFRTRKR